MPITKETDPGWTVQETAKRTNLSAHTLRYYERAGLIPSVPRDAENGHRRYRESDLATIEFLKRLRTAGMPIRDMQRYISLRKQGDSTVEERRVILEEHGESVRRQIAELRACLEVIEFKINSYCCIEADQHRNKLENKQGNIK